MKKTDVLSDILAIEEQAKLELKHNLTRHHLKIKQAEIDSEKNFLKFKKALLEDKDNQLTKQAALNQKKIQTIVNQAKMDVKKLQEQTKDKLPIISENIAQKAKALLCP